MCDPLYTVCAEPAPSKLGTVTVTSRFDELISTLAGLFISTLAGLKSSKNINIGIDKFVHNPN